MSSNTVDIKFNKYYSLLNKSQKESVIQMLKSFVQGNKKNGPSIEDYNEDIDHAIAEYKKGDVLSHDAVVKMAKKW